MSNINAREAFGLKVIGRAEHGGQRWVVVDDGAYRLVVSEGHFDDTGFATREEDDERRVDDYTEWCGRGLWAKDDAAAEVAALCGLTHVHSTESGVCSRVEAVETTEQ